MTPRLHHRRRPGRDRAQGQMIVIFALCLTAIISMAGLLVDGGMAWAERREAQSAADTAALAAARAIVKGASATDAARTIAATNGFPANLVDCAGVTHVNGSVVVNRPPTQGAHTTALDPVNANDYVEVITSRAVHTTFAAAVGQGCWMVSARAVSSIGTKSVAKCSFCSLNDSYGNHTLVLKNGATLRVDGDIVVNSRDGLTGDSKVSFDGTTCVAGQEAGKYKGDFFVCGDGFDIFGTGGTISARTISVTGGWETHDFNIAWADALAEVNGAPCPLHTQPLGYSSPVANVCLGMPTIADPLNDSLTPKNIIPVPPVVGAPVAGVNGCPAGASIPTGTAVAPALKTISAGSATICPGTYYGGLMISGTAAVTMMPGVYYMAGGGFTVTNSAAVDGTAGVMIYNSSGSAGVADTNPGVDLVPAKTKGKKDTTGVTLTSNAGTNPTVGQAIALTMQVVRKDSGSPTPTGVMTFYDGQNPITGCSDLPVVPGSTTGSVKAVCNTSWSTFGTKSVSSVYEGDPVYNAVGGALIITITVPAGATIAPITINSTGNVKLYGGTNDTYKGLVMFQDRTSTLTITLAPTSGASGCTDDWLTQDVPDVAGVDPPAACGALGGLRGTIYAAHDDALVYITASGLADLQVIAGKIQVDSNADARFAFTPQYFANGSIRLVE